MDASRSADDGLGGENVTSATAASKPSLPSTSPIAICGIGLRLPGGIRSGDDFWDVLIHGKDTQGPVPASRFNIDGFYDAQGSPGAIKTKHGYFLEEDLATSFDASFFSMSKSELERCDPQQRLLLEVTRECFEDSGEVDYLGKRIGCYIGTFGQDWYEMSVKESQDISSHTVTGFSDMMLANRVSYEYDLRGPSMVLKTGCSASLVALHEACRALQAGDVVAALVGGTSLIVSPRITALFFKEGVLSPDASCKTFDARADGFARAEGIACVYLKRLDDALRDGNPVRAIIRGTASNSDGRSHGLMNPSAEAHEALMRSVYNDTGLLPRDTSFVECHGTGTKVGDPIEAIAVGNVFGEHGVYITSVKPNVGLSEGCSGITSLIKGVLTLEHRIIPPNIKFEVPNPKIAFVERKLIVPVRPTEFPADRAERISINSFGIGGSNAHVIIESKAQYLRVPYAPPNGFVRHQDFPGLGLGQTSGFDSPTNSHSPIPMNDRSGELFLLSANSQSSLKRQMDLYEDYLRRQVREDHGRLSDIAYTLAVRREKLTHRAFLILDENGEVSRGPMLTKAPSSAPSLIMVFSGQAAQWPAMGRNLILSNPSFHEDLIHMDTILQDLKRPPSWSLLDEIQKPPETSRIHEAELAQPLSTALQIAIFRQLKNLGVTPAAVIGHSSGEIAAAYAAGHISLKYALALAHYRGFVVCAYTEEVGTTAGGMAVVGMGAEHVSRFLSQSGVCIACENSPGSTTISGDREAVQVVLNSITQQLPDVLARWLKVETAYHSHHMAQLAQKYLALMNSEAAASPAHDNAESSLERAVFMSSVTCEIVTDDTSSTPEYWVSNLVSPVRFSTAASNLMSLLSPEDDNANKNSTLLLEIGPHATLAGPLRDICSANTHPYHYINCQTRNKNSAVELWSALGRVFQEGVDIDWKAMYPTGRQTLGGLPPYPWDHSGPYYWHESRLSSAWRYRRDPHHCLLGSRVVESPDNKPLWRNVLHLEHVPWISNHRIRKDVVFPLTGYVSLAGEALRQTVEAENGYRLRHVTASAALVMTQASPVELVTTLSIIGDSGSFHESSWFDFTINSFNGSNWVEHCEGQVAALDRSRGLGPATNMPESGSILSRVVSSSRFYETMAKIGINYGPDFQLLSDIASSATEKTAGARLTCPRSHTLHEMPFHLHPATMDACIQLLLIANAKGLCRNLVEVVMPTKIAEIEVASHLHSSNLHAWAGGFERNNEDAVAECTAASGQVVFRLSGLRVTPLEVDEEDDQDVHAAAVLQWLPDIDFVDIDKLLERPVRDPAQMKLEDRLTLLCILESAEKVVDLAPSHPHLEKYRSWLKLQIIEAQSAHHSQLRDASEMVNLTRQQRLEELDATFQEIMESPGNHGLSQAIKRINDNAHDIFVGRRDVLDLLTQDNILSDIYDGFSYGYGNLVRLLSHKRPNLRILEVGAGTGGTTHRTLRYQIDEPGFPPYSTYMFTDISAGFFPQAKKRLAYADNLDFATLDISQDPLAQGFEAASYDLILAPNVVHATPSLHSTLRNLEVLLKTDGILLLTEISTVTKAPNYVFGNFSGWWLGDADDREWEPYVTPSRWDQELKAAGLTGAEAIVADSEAPFQVCVTIMSRPDRSLKSRLSKSLSHVTGNVTLLCDSPSSTLAQKLLSALRFRYGATQVSICTLEDVIPVDQDIIACIGLEQLFLGEGMTEASFSAFQELVRHIKNQRVLWLTRRFQIRCQDPRSAETLGVARTLRSELDLRFFTLEIDPREIALVGLVLTVFDKIRFVEDNKTLNADREYVVESGNIYVGRFHPFNLVNKLSMSAAEDNQSGKGSEADSYPDAQLRVHIGKPGRLDTLQWRHESRPVYSSPVLAGHEVEIDVRVMGLNFKDVLLASGVLRSRSWTSDSYESEYIDLGIEASGVVRRVGFHISDMKPGDRVMALSPKSTLKTQFIVHASSVVRIPDSLSFEAAATVPLCFSTVMYSLIEVGRLKRGQSVLIHSACGGVGLAAIQVCKMIGAEIFATVDIGNGNKIQHLTNLCNIPRDHIYSSRDTSFAVDVLRESRGRGVDLVLNSLTGDLLHESWRCVAEYGTMIELGKRDLEASGRLDMTPFLGNRSYVGVDFHQFIRDRPVEVGRLLTRFLELYEKGLLRPLEPVSCFDALAVKQAFRHLQQASHIGKVIIRLPKDSSQRADVPSLQRDVVLSGSNVAYLLVGGSTGLGASIATWLVEKGARNLVFLSRNSGVSPGSQVLFKELEATGCCVTAIAGRVDNAQDVQKAIESCKMPIRGVFDLAMILDDCSFPDMTWIQWKAAVNVKVKGAWNLHNYLASHPLDFFWMASSIVSMIDQPGQCNYSAGCAFLEAFCQYRHSKGLPASVINICPIDGIVYMAKDPRAKRNMKSQGLYFLGEREFLDFVKLQLLDQGPGPVCHEEEQVTQESSDVRGTAWQNTGQIVAGLRSASEVEVGYGLDDINNKTNWRRDRRMGIYHNLRLNQNAKSSRKETTVESALARFVARIPLEHDILAESGTVDFIAREIGAQVLGFMLRPNSDVDVGKTLTQLGLDSLLALELCRWLRHVFGVSVSVLEIVASGTLLQLGEVVRDKLVDSVCAGIEIS